MTKKRIISGLVLIFLLFIPVLISAQTTRYIFTTFKGDAAADQKLWVYTSTDGTHFYHLYNGYGGPTGTVRDPSIIKQTDGYYYVAHTVYSWTTESSYFAIARSSDLTNWSHHVSIDSGISNVRNVWAPEFYVEGNTVRIIVSMRSQTSQFRPYIFTATNTSLTSWSGPVDMGIGENHIDTFLVKSGSTYHAFLKDESSKYIEHCTSSGITGPWNWVGTGNWAGWGTGYEGPCLFQLDNGTWRMYLDNYSSGSGLFATSSPDLSSWSGLSGISVDTSGVVRHGTVLKENTGPTPEPTVIPPEAYPIVYSVSSEPETSHPASNILDGDLDAESRWSAQIYPQWVIIDYGRTRQFSRFDLYTYEARSYQYRIEVSNNPDSEYFVVVDRSSNTETIQPFTDTFGTVSGRYVRITVSGASGYTGNWISLIELDAPGETTETPAPTPEGTPGDVNNDSTIDIVDALLIAQFYVGLNPASFDQSKADVNCDSGIDIVDALLIAQYYVGLIFGFC
ncbi:MAG: discoidin domain-containing protein [Spirochaetales bacterium]|nr:discoidin domain-containing protein [Spirochaetales bacterium]